MVIHETNDSLNWRDILVREWYYGVDEAYQGRVGKLIGLVEDTLDESALAETERPYTYEVEAALRQACRRRKARYGWDERLKRLDRARRKHPPLADLLEQLHAHHWLARFIAHHLILPYGSEAIEPLHYLVETGRPELQQTALWLLRSIGAETTTRLGPAAATLICPACVVHCSPRPISFSRHPAIVYYGCRACGQSLSFEPRPERIVAVLDESMTERQVRQADSLRVNWLQQGRLFDFDLVEVIQATDEAVERFAVRVGNDTDAYRVARHGRMPCVIAPTCRVSENTRRILQQIFGEVRE